MNTYNIISILTIMVLIPFSIYCFMLIIASMKTKELHQKQHHYGERYFCLLND